MADTITRSCKVCEEDFDSIYQLDNGICDECAEKDGAELTDHYEETIQHRELNSGLI